MKPWLRTNLSGVIAARGRAVDTDAALGSLADGQDRCPVCEGVASVTRSGARIHAHRTPSGDACPSRLRSQPESVPLAELPPVVIPETRTGPPPLAASTTDRRAPGPRISGSCQDCGAFVTGERRYCGKCAARRMRNRGAS